MEPAQDEDALYELLYDGIARGKRELSKVDGGVVEPQEFKVTRKSGPCVAAPRLPLLPWLVPPTCPSSARARTRG